MSIDIMNRLWWREDLPTMEKFVGIALADTAGDTGVCWPAIATIAHKCSCSERTVQNAIKGLIGKQLLKRIERRDRSSYFIFNLTNLPLVERPKRTKELGPHEVVPTGESPAPDLFCTGESGSVTGESGSMTGAGDSPRTVIEPSIEPPIDSTGDLKSPTAELVEFVERKWAELSTAHPGIRAVRKIDDGLRHAIELRGKQHARPGETTIDVWTEALDNIGASRFLQGRAPPGPGRDEPFKLSLAWATKASSFREIISGKYNSDRSSDDGYDPHTGRRLGPTAQAALGSIARFRASREQGRRGRDQGGADA